MQPFSSVSGRFSQGFRALFTLKPDELDLYPDQIYLDNMSSTKCDSRVLDEMLPFFSEFYGNPSAITHAQGWRAADALEKARSRVAHLVSVDPDEIVFTSGATESINTALRGVDRIIQPMQSIGTTAVEHKATIEVLKRSPHKTALAPLDDEGRVKMDTFQSFLEDERIGLFTTLFVNNETGAINPYLDIASACRDKEALLHLDCAQACGKIPVDLSHNGISLASFSSHKMHGPKGIGALYIKRGLDVEPLIYGGGQESGIRGGTTPVMLAVGFGKACEIQEAEMVRNTTHIEGLRNVFIDVVSRKLPNVRIVTDIPNCVTCIAPGIEGEATIIHMDKIAVSTGSACTSESLEGSHVISSIYGLVSAHCSP
ncbi:hypothetical protein PCE1_001911 [Barthelona sp. PCE]